MRRILSFLILAIVFATPSFAQKKELKVKFGKISDKEAAMTSYEPDPAAPAVVLFDKGTVSHRYDDQNGFSIVFERHARMKIFKKDALHLADIMFVHHKDQRVSDIKGVSYNMENGKLAETKLSKENVFTEEVTKNYRMTKFIIPAVKEGSIIEFTYTWSATGATGLPNSWVFQREKVPTIWSEFDAAVPSFIDFKKSSSGWETFSLAEESQTTDKMNIMLKDKGDGMVATTTFENVAVDYTLNKLHFIQENVPALKTEDYVYSANDYLSSINFEIRAIYDTDFMFTGNGYRLINGLPRVNSSTWGNLGRDLYDDVYEKDLDSDKYTADMAKSCTAGKTTVQEKIAAVYEHIGTNFLVNDHDRIFMSQQMSELVKDRKGTPTDLNILMTNMLRKAGLKAYPVVMSTTDNGKVFSFRVQLYDMNRVITAVEMEDSTLMLVDASNYPNPVGLLAAEDLGNQGLLLKSKEEIKWIPLQNKVSVKTAVIANFNLATDGKATGQTTCYLSGYGGVSKRKEIKEKGESLAVKQAFKEWFAEGEHTDLKVANATNWNEPSLKIEFKLESASFCEASGDKIYLSPMLGLGLHENPFKQPERKFNVDFGPIAEESYNMSFAIPPGYKVEEMPKSTKVNFGDNHLIFDYLVENNGTVLKFNVRLKRKTDSVDVGAYADMKQFFSTVASKMEEKVVLTKI